MLSALNSRLRRRNSHGAPTTTTANLPTTIPAPKQGPQRTTKNAQKLKLLPNTDPDDDGIITEEESSRDVYSQFTRIKDPTARRDAARLGKADRDRLPRVTAYCTANSYRMEGVLKFLKGRAKTRGAAPKQVDECIYSPFDYDYLKKEKKAQQQKDAAVAAAAAAAEESQAQTTSDRRHSDSTLEVDGNNKQRREDLIDFQDERRPESTEITSFEDQIKTTVTTPEIFVFDYGTVVIWGMTPAQETRFLTDISKFAISALAPDDTQVENFNFYYTKDYQARIYNDFISLRDPKNYMLKLAISHALSQSVKTSLFEDLVSTTIATTSPLPAQIAQFGSVNLNRKQINMQIGELFILRINIHLQGSVLDSPELFWAEPQLEPVYSAVRSYLEMDQRASLLTERLNVIADLLAVLKDQLGQRHGELLEWIGEFALVQKCRS